MATKDTSVTTIDDTPAPAAAPRATKVATSAEGAEGMSGEKAEVTIHAGEGETGRQAVFLAINGHGILIPRGVPCVVPVEIVDILDNATMTKYEPGHNGQMIEHEVKRYSYNSKSVRTTK